MTRIGIVGSRRRTDIHFIESFIDSLLGHVPKDTVIVSGGCKGVDTWAESRAVQYTLQTMIFKPNLDNITDKGDMVNRYYQRNKQIVEHSDVIIAFVSLDRTGGTENTIGWAKKLNIPVLIVEEKK